MASKAKALPAGWTVILDEVQARLDQALTSVNARIDPPHEHLEARAPLRHQEIDQWNERLRRLSSFLESADQIVQSVDEALAKEETYWRYQLTLCETLRQKAG
jgi:hypothetical protein